MARMRIGQEEDVEGHGFRFKDGEGNDWIIDSDRVQAVTVRDASGKEHEVEGHVYKRFEQDPDVEGHMPARYGRDDGQEVELEEAVRVTYLDDDGREQEVQAHSLRGR
jgi:hypothetical protein